MLPHQAHHLLVVDEAASGMQFGGHTPIAVARPLCADLLDAFVKPSLLYGHACWLVVIGRSRELHQPASFTDAEITGPLTTDIVSLLGRSASREAPFRNSFSNA